MSEKTLQSQLFAKNGLIALPNHLAIKDKNCRFVALTESIVKRTGYKNIEDVIGITDHDLKCPSVQFADNFIEQDKKIMALKQSKQFLDYRYDKKGNIKISMAEKSPIIYDDVVEGIAISSIEISLATLNQFNTWLVQNIIQKKPAPSAAQYTYFEVGELVSSDLKLTPRQQEVLFFLLRGKRAIDIAEQLFLSKRTIEDHVEGLKKKFNCPDKVSLIEKAIAEGYLYLLPTRFLK